MFEVNLRSDGVEWKWNPFVLGSVVAINQEEEEEGGGREVRERMINHHFTLGVGDGWTLRKDEKGMISV